MVSEYAAVSPPLTDAELPSIAAAVPLFVPAAAVPWRQAALWTEGLQLLSDVALLPFWLQFLRYLVILVVCLCHSLLPGQTGFEDGTPFVDAADYTMHFVAKVDAGLAVIGDLPLAWPLNLIVWGLRTWWYYGGIAIPAILVRSMSHSVWAVFKTLFLVQCPPLGLPVRGRG